MNDSASSIISKVWSFCNTLRDDGVGCGDYLEQLTYLLFLKLADEFSRPPLMNMFLHNIGDIDSEAFISPTDYRTNIHHTLKKNPLKLDDLRDFIHCYQPENRHARKESWHPETNPEGQWRKFTYDEIVNRDKTSLDIFWLRDKSLADLDNLPDPDVLANDIIENLEAAVASFKEIAQRI